MEGLTSVHVSEERIVFPVGREPYAAVLRQIYVLVCMHYGGLLRAHCADHHFGIDRAYEREFCNRLTSHQQWLEHLATRSLHGAVISSQQYVAATRLLAEPPTLLLNGFPLIQRGKQGKNDASRVLGIRFRAAHCCAACRQAPFQPTTTTK